MPVFLMKWKKKSIQGLFSLNNALRMLNSNKGNIKVIVWSRVKNIFLVVLILIIWSVISMEMCLFAISVAKFGVPIFRPFIQFALCVSLLPLEKGVNCNLSLLRMRLLQACDICQVVQNLFRTIDLKCPQVLFPLKY